MIFFTTINWSADQEKLLNDMAESNSIHGESFGIVGIKSDQYKRYEKMKKIFSNSELLTLLEHDSSAVKIYALYTLLGNKYEFLYLQVALNALKNDSIIHTRYGCTRSSEHTSDLELEALDAKLNEEEKYLILKESLERNLNRSYSNQLLEKLSAREELYDNIKKVSLSGNTSAMLALAKFSKKEDAEIVWTLKELHFRNFLKAMIYYKFKESDEELLKYYEGMKKEKGKHDEDFISSILIKGSDTTNSIASKLLSQKRFLQEYQYIILETINNNQLEEKYYPTLLQMLEYDLTDIPTILALDKINPKKTEALIKKKLSEEGMLKKEYLVNYYFIYYLKQKDIEFSNQYIVKYISKNKDLSFYDILGLIPRTRTKELDELILKRLKTLGRYEFLEAKDFFTYRTPDPKMLKKIKALEKKTFLNKK